MWGYKSEGSNLEEGPRGNLTLCHFDSTSSLQKSEKWISIVCKPPKSMVFCYSPLNGLRKCLSAVFFMFILFRVHRAFWIHAWMSVASFGIFSADIFSYITFAPFYLSPSYSKHTHVRTSYHFPNISYSLLCVFSLDISLHFGLNISSDVFCFINLLFNCV